MKNFVLLLLVACSTLTYGQKYKTGGSSQAYKLVGADTIFANKSLYENIKNIPQFSSAAKIMELTNMQAELDKLGMCTVFLPTNAAFNSYDPDALKALLSSANADQLKAAFMSHVITGRVDANSLFKMIEQNSGSAVYRSPGDMDPEITLKGTIATLNVPDAPKASVTDTNFFHANGYLHFVDGFLLPQKNN